MSEACSVSDLARQVYLDICLTINSYDSVPTQMIISSLTNPYSILPFLQARTIAGLSILAHLLSIVGPSPIC